MYGTYCRLHVLAWDSDIAVIRAVRKKFKPSVRRTRKDRDARHKVYRQMLDYHHNEQVLLAEYRM